jgi:hypothetical protein
MGDAAGDESCPRLYNWSKAGMDPAIVPAARASATTETANSARSVRNI